MHYASCVLPKFEEKQDENQVREMVLVVVFVTAVVEMLLVLREFSV